MFRLTRAKYITALQSAEVMEAVLAEENRRLKQSGAALHDSWHGTQSEKTLGMIKESLESGSHAKALAYIHGMTTIMSEYLPEIEKLMAKREQIGEQLKQDEYKAPDLSCFQEEELIIDYDYIDDVKADAEGALHYGDAAIKTLREMIAEAEACAGEYLDLSEAKELLEEGEKELHRLENYRDEFVDFGKKMSDLEYSMSADLSRIMTEQGDLQTALHVMGDTATDQRTRAEQMTETEEYLLLQPGKENAIIGAGVDILKMTAETGDPFIITEGDFDEERYREIWQPVWDRIDSWLEPDYHMTEEEVLQARIYLDDYFLGRCKLEYDPHLTETEKEEMDRFGKLSTKISRAEAIWWGFYEAGPMKYLEELAERCLGLDTTAYEEARCCSAN